MANPAGQLALAAWTYPAQKVAARVDVYDRWPTSTSMGRMSVDKFSHSYHNMDVTNMKLLDHAGSSTYRNGSGQMSRVLRMGDGRKVVIHNAQNRWIVNGSKGLFSSIVGAGLIDGAFQTLGDWASGMCLSPNQYFWRFYWAFTFGLIAGIFGAVAVGAGVAVGLPAVSAGIAGWGVSLIAGVLLSKTKSLYIDAATVAAR